MEEVDQLLHSQAPLVVVEAAAGCGKTWTAAKFAKEMSARLPSGRVLLLSHTHGACGEFHRRCHGSDHRIDVETCDSFALKVIAPYAGALSLPVPLEPAVGRPEGVPFATLSLKAVELIGRAPTIARIISANYPILILDEHQDATVAQHELAMLLLKVGGSRLRVFGDPMQALHQGLGETYLDWNALWRSADARTELTDPRRWKSSPALGEWITQERTTLRTGNPIRMADAPTEVVLRSTAQLAGRRKFRDPALSGEIVGTFLDDGPGPAVAIAHLADMVRALGQSGNWRATVNEGAVLEHLDRLLSCSEIAGATPAMMSRAFLEFSDQIGTGFHKAMRQSLIQRLDETIDLRHAGSLQRPWLQALEEIYVRPDHRGLAAAMERLLIETPNGYRVRFQDHAATLRALSRTDDPRGHLHALSRLRRRRRLPRLSVSTIHKAKGLEFRRVLICPADQHQFPAGGFGARLLYVAMSRATHRLDIVTDTASPLAHFNLS